MASIADEYEPLEVIGKGSFGTVRKVRQKSNGEILVRKEIEYTSMSVQEKTHIISELRILRELDHPNVVKYYRHDHVPEKKSIHIYQEYCDGGDLAKVISTFKREQNTVPEGFIWEVLVQMLLALHRCHYGIDAKKVDLFAKTGRAEPRVDAETVIIHRDIKPDNIFLLDSGKTVKLGDFGLAKMLTLQNDFAKTYVGTPYYMSPEVLMDNPYSPVCDIWSLGCVLYELCALQPPFTAKTHMLLQAKIKKGVIGAIPATYSLQLGSIISDCITVDPAQRPTCFDLLDVLNVRLFRKEFELSATSRTLEEFQKQLLIKHEELRKKEASLKALEGLLRSQELQARGLEAKLRDEQAFRQQELGVLRKELQARHKKLELELLEDFSARKHTMDQEAKEVRLHYQREFRHVVEQEVQARLAEYVRKQGGELQRQKSDSSSSSLEKLARTPPKPRGPRELHEHQHAKRPPLSAKNTDWDEPVGRHQVPKRRITDEMERLALQKRNVPEYEEVYMRNYRHA